MPRMRAYGLVLVLQFRASGDLPVLPELRSQPERPLLEPSLRGGRPHHRHLELEVPQRPGRPGGDPRRALPPPPLRARDRAGPRRAHSQRARADPDRRPAARYVRAPRRGDPRHRHGRLPRLRRPAALQGRSSGSCLPKPTEQGATLAADKIRRSIATHDFGTAGNWRRITVSCGAATIGVITGAARAEAGLLNRREYTGNLLSEAYQALEAGRSAGTNRTSIGAFRSA